LLFNEGCQSQQDLSIRKDLLNQSMYLCKLLIDNSSTPFSEVFAAMALNCFHASRIESRVTEDGSLILLADQDRSLWNQELINHRLQYLSKSSIEAYVTSYHFEAAIAYEHCSSKTIEDTDWVMILSYYDGLLALHPSAVTALNRFIVFYKVHGFDKTKQELDTSNYQKEWESMALYYSFLGDMYKPFDTGKSRELYTLALKKTKVPNDIKIIEDKLLNL